MTHPTREKSLRRRALRTKMKAYAVALEKTIARRRGFFNKDFMNRAHRYGMAQVNEPLRVDLQKQVLLNKMTNWQRNNCLIACKGDIRKMSVGQMQRYAVMPHWKLIRDPYEREQVISMRLGKLVDFGNIRDIAPDAA